MLIFIKRWSLLITETNSSSKWKKKTQTFLFPPTGSDNELLNQCSFQGSLFSPILTEFGLAANWCLEILVPVLAEVVESALTFLYSCPSAKAWRFFSAPSSVWFVLEEMRWGLSVIYCHCTWYTVHWCESLFCTASVGEGSSKLCVKVQGLGSSSLPAVM